MIVFSNAVYGWIKASQKTGYDERYFSVDFKRTNHALVAEAFGVKAWRVEDPADLEAALKAAKVEYEAFIYAGTNHGFHNDTTPRFDKAAAELSWTRTIEFFKKKLG